MRATRDNYLRVSLITGLVITGLDWTGLDWNPKICFMHCGMQFAMNNYL